MKVLHIIASLSRAAGTSVFCVNVCDGLSRLGIETAIAVQQQAPDDYWPRENVPVLDVSRNFDLFDFKPDLVHIHGLWNPFLHWASRWAWRTSLPIVHSPHGMLTPWALRTKWHKKWLALAAYQYWDLRRAKLLHATAESEVDDIRRIGLKQPVGVVPLGVDLPNVEEDLKENREGRANVVLFVSRIHPKKGLSNLIEAWAALKRNVNSRPLTVNGSVDTGRRGTDADTLLRIHNVPWQLVIAGPDEEGTQDKLVKQAEMLGLTVSCKRLTMQKEGAAAGVWTSAQDSWLTTDGLPFTDVIFTGPVFGEGKDALYQMADLFVLPTYSENFGVVVIEALAHRVPVITTKGTPWGELENCGGEKCVNAGMRECLNERDGNQAIPQSGSLEQSENHSANAESVSGNQALRPVRAGWWIDIGVEPLIQVLMEAMSLTNEERSTMGENGRALVERKYTWPAIAETMKQAYEWTLEKGEKVPSCVRC